MEGEPQAVCKFHQSGYCKFRSSCKYFHTHDTCFDSHCDQKSCTARHPLPCKYFFQLGFCRFGTTCSYKHCVSPLQDNLANTVNNIKDEIELVKAMLQTKDMEIKKLEDKVNTLELKIVSNEKSLKCLSTRENIVEEVLEDSSTPFKCEKCSYSATSKTVLKRHNTIKHQHDTPETLRDFDFNDSLQLSTSSEYRIHEKDSDVFDNFCIEETEFNCKYWRCHYMCTTEVRMLQHISNTHAINESFVYPESTEEAECPDCGQTFFVDHKFALHMYTEHYFSFNCDHCGEHYPGDVAMFKIHLKMCKVPCHGDLNCPCKLLAT